MPEPDGDEEEDYMSMVIEEPRARETFSQRKLRLQREAEAKARVPSKAERAAAEHARREQALASSVLHPSNKGYQMMLKLGFEPSSANAAAAGTAGAAGESAEGRVTDRFSAAEPLPLNIKQDRGGIGLDSEKKRKFREDTAAEAKRAKADETEYRERVRREREERRLEAQVHAAQSVAEKLDQQQQQEEKEEGEPQQEQQQQQQQQINVLYRGLVRDREEREREKRVRQMLETSLPSSFFPRPRLGSYKEDDDDDDDDNGEEAEDHEKEADEIKHSFIEQDQPTEDPELDEFNALPPAERLQRLVLYLREKHWYCFWCKTRYPDSTLDGCPGITEEDHD